MWAYSCYSFLGSKTSQDNPAHISKLVNSQIKVFRIFILNMIACQNPYKIRNFDIIISEGFAEC